ncbi:unnamed protein product [Wuchereria bancrofti]|uniref:Uncharacterized protein n=1 Tax=Wuchereria bancrofti TaxID=6293 RepID=A0A3P7G5Z7_WUCBA|nr:unnamed protein product [Wuchereria bancrofti]
MNITLGRRIRGWWCTEKQSTTTKRVTVPGPEPSLRLGNEDEFNGSKGFNYPSLSIKQREFRRREIQRVEKYNGKNNILAINDDVQATIKHQRQFKD